MFEALRAPEGASHSFSTQLRVLAIASLAALAGCEKEQSQPTASTPSAGSSTGHAHPAKTATAPEQDIKFSRFIDGVAIDVSDYDAKGQELIQNVFYAAVQVMKLDPKLVEMLGDQRGLVVPFLNLDEVQEKLSMIMPRDQAEKAVAELKSQNADALTLTLGSGNEIRFHAIFVRQDVLQTFSRLVAVLNHELWHVGLNTASGNDTQKTTAAREVEAYGKSVDSLTRIHEALKAGAQVPGPKMAKKLLDQLGQRIEEEAERKRSWGK